MTGCKKGTPGFNRACGKASTYNNAACRGRECREAIRVLRADQRSAADTQKPKKK